MFTLVTSNYQPLMEMKQHVMAEDQLELLKGR